MKYYIYLLLLIPFAVNSEQSSENLPDWFNELTYLNGEDIVERRISQVTLTISQFDRDNPNFDDSLSKEQIEDLKHTCIKRLKRFDNRGNLVGDTMIRTGSWVVYQYDNFNNLIQLAHQNKADGTLDIFENDPKSILDSELRHKALLKQKLSLIKPHERLIVDSCASIDGIYLVQGENSERGLPLKAKAKLIKNGNKVFNDKYYRSAETLYIYFEYEFDNYYELEWSPVGQTERDESNKG